MARRIRQPRTRSMRFILAGLLVIPLVSLVALWAFAAKLTLGNALAERNYNTFVNQAAGPSIALNNQLSQERLATYTWLSADRQGPAAPLAAARSRTDAAVAAYRHESARARSGVSTAVLRAQDALAADLAKIPSIRAAVDAGAMTPAAAFQAYSNMLDAQFAVYNANQVNDIALYQQAQASVEAARAAEQVGREAALVAGAAASNGQMSASERELFATAVADQRLLMSDALAQFSQPVNGMWAHLYSSPAHQRLAALEDRIAASVGSNGPLPVNIKTWQAVSGAFLAGMQATVTREAPPLAQLASQLSSRLLLEAIVAGGLGLAAVVASILLTVWFARRLTRELTGLHDSAESIANERLPGIVERLRRGDEVDVDAESPPPAPGKITEIAKVAQAFATVQRTAVEAAVGQANLRKGVNQVFLNLSLRNQSLLHRQLGMLDAMERATSDPTALADLFRLDHLTTRMRRHAEGLIILSGATPGRGWRDPVPVVDVLRAAAAEVEDYVRVDVVSESPDSVIGTAVNDVIHLVAELVENATAFSPPNTQVEIRADAVGSGFAVEVEDRGLGLTADEMAEINERLANPPEFDLAHSDQLGLFVVGQLAARHGIRVSLSGSPYGGVRAVVLLPSSLIVRDGEMDGTAGLRGGGRPTVWEPAASPPSPQATDVVANRARASAFSLTGRHRMTPGPSGGQAAPGLPATMMPGEPGGQAAPGLPPRIVPGEPGGHAGPAGTDSADAGTHLGLPIRVRQASLAPQLRNGPDPDPDTDPTAAEGLSPRSPEHARSLMTALQDGWQQGRADDLDHPAGRPDAGPGGARGTETPGGQAWGAESLGRQTDSSEGEAT